MGLHWKLFTLKPRTRQGVPLLAVLQPSTSTSRVQKRKKKKKHEDWEGIYVDDLINHIQIQKGYRQFTTNKRVAW